ncbi:hypothetical protein thsps21_05930 [Pseudomonas sp. No.21]
MAASCQHSRQAAREARRRGQRKRDVMGFSCRLAPSGARPNRAPLGMGALGFAALSTGLRIQRLARACFWLALVKSSAVPPLAWA